MTIRRLLLSLAGLMFGLLTVFALPAGPASAHAVLERTVPSQGSVVQTAPNQVVITFDEVVSPVQEKIRVIGPDGKLMGDGPARQVGNELRIPVRPGGPRGTYVVSYRVISADSHPVGAGFSYSVGAPSTNNASVDSTTRTNRAVAIGVSAARYLGYAGLIIVIGPALILAALWPRRLDRSAPTRLANIGIGVLVLATILELYLEVPYSIGGTLFDVSRAELSSVLTSRYGVAHLVRLAAIAICWPLLPGFLAGASRKVTQLVLGGLAVIGVGTWSVSGHPGTSAAPSLTIVADAAHVSSMAIWLGGLVMLFAFLLRRANARELGAILPVWSNWATLAVTVLVLAGTAQALIEIGTFGALVHTTYGLLVLAKVGLLGAVLCVAAFSRRLVLRRAVLPAQVSAEVAAAEMAARVAAAVPVSVGAGGGSLPAAGDDGPLVAAAGDDPSAGADAQAGDEPPDAGADHPEDPPADSGSVTGGTEPEPDPAGLRRLRRAVLIEVLGALVILGLTSALVQTAPARSAAATEATADGQAGIFSATVTTNLYQLQFDMEPDATGTNDLHLYAYTPAGAPLKVLEWHASAGLPAQNIEPIAATLQQITESHAIGQIVLPRAGDWQFSFTLRTTEIDEATVVTTVKIN